MPTTVAREKARARLGAGSFVAVCVAGALIDGRVVWERDVIEVNGLLEAGEERIGRFVFRLYRYAGLPILQAWIRVFNSWWPCCSSWATT